MPFSQLNKLKSRIKNGTEATLNLSSNVISNSIEETSFPNKFSSTDRQVPMLRQSFANNSSANKIFQKLNCPKSHNQESF